MSIIDTVLSKYDQLKRHRDGRVVCTLLYINIVYTVNMLHNASVRRVLWVQYNTYKILL